MHLDELKRKTETEQAEWFMTAVDSPEPPLGTMFDLLVAVAAGGGVARADDWANLLQDVLAERGNREALVRLLRLRAAWREQDPAFGAACERVLAGAFKDRLGQAILKSVGFDKGLKPAECLRRLEVLFRLRPGVLCLEKTWGFGVVARVDEFYQKVTIEFTRKPAHAMTFAYAAETLALLGEDHLLARKHRDPAALATLTREQPAELVRLALRSFGPLSAPDLKDRLAEAGLVSDADWKSFWDAARAALKADPLVEIPARRSDPIRLLAAERSYGDAWGAKLLRERDVTTIYKQIEEALQAGADLAGADLRAALADRLAFALRAARGSVPELASRLLLLAERAGVGEVPGETAAAVDSLLEPRGLAEALNRLPAREARRILEYLDGRDRRRTTRAALAVLGDLNATGLPEALGYLQAQGLRVEFAEGLRSILNRGEARASMLLWLCRNPEAVAEWGMGLPDLLNRVVECMEQDLGGDDLKAQKLLRALFEQEWLVNTMAALDARHREDAIARVNASRGWEPAAKRSVLAKLIRLYPELQAIIAGGPGAVASAKRPRFTSWRSYRERQEQFRKLVEETIPENSREIAVARSYGDLSENFEYHAAKHQQGLLLKRKGELETDLSTVRGTDFASFPADAAGMGTMVAIRRPDGREERYAILGEWDRDEALGIISSESKLAQMLEGRTAGEDVALPGAAGEETCRVLAVEPLTEEIQAWVAAGGGIASVPPSSSQS